MASVPTDIRTNGAGDYLDIDLWDADDGGGDGLGNDDCTGSCYWDGTAFDDSYTIDFSANSITLTVPEAERHDGTAGTGARIVKTSDQRCIFFDQSTSGDYTLSWLECDSNSQGTGSDGYVVAMTCGDNLESGDFTEISHCIIHHNDAHNYNEYGIYVHDIGTPGGNTINNNVVYRIARGFGTGNGVAAAINSALSGGDVDRTVYTNTCYHVTGSGTEHCYGIEGTDDASNLVKDNIAVDCHLGTNTGDQEDFQQDNPSNADYDYNLSSDSTAAGAHSITGATAADQFVSTASGFEDLHLKDTDADAFEPPGDDLGTTPSGVEVDADGYDRDAGGTTWSMGAFDGNELRGAGAVVGPTRSHPLGISRGVGRRMVAA